MRAVHKVADIVRLSMHSLRVHAVRSILTSLGIIFGVCGVIAMLAFTEGAGRQAQLYLRELGSDKIIIRSVKPPEEGRASGSRRGAKIFGLTHEDVRRFWGNLPAMQRCVTVHESRMLVWHRAKKLGVRVVATGPELRKVAAVKLAAGRFLTAGDMLLSPRPRGACVLPAALARRLFGPFPVLGRSIWLSNSRRRHPFTVVGLLAEVPRVLQRGADGGEDCVLVAEPVRRRRFGDFSIETGQGTWQLEKVEVTLAICQMRDEQDVMPASRVIESLLARYHEQEDHAVVVPKALLEQKRKQTRLWAIVLLVIAGISLVVGGIGIMNIMLASVTERTREIGIRRALGAKRTDIAVQFLVEAVALTTIGGLVGIALGLGVNWAVNQAAFLPFRTVITAWAPVLPFLMAVTVGLVSGLYPAVRAAKLDPIEALRHE
jgi:putative ABC transport system permease protein